MREVIQEKRLPACPGEDVYKRQVETEKAEEDEEEKRKDHALGCIGPKTKKAQKSK